MPFNIAQEVVRQAVSRSSRIAFAGRDGTVAYGSFADRVERTSLRIAALCKDIPDGVPRIGVLCPSGVQHAVLMLAVMRAGGCAVPIAGESPAPEREQIRTISALHGVLSPVVTGWGQDPVALADDVYWESFGRVEPVYPVESFEALNPAFVRFSSGTTGASKGVVLSHDTLRERVASANRRLGITSEDRVLWTLPMAHHFAVSILLYLHNGATIVLPDGQLASEMLSSARENDATVFYGSPFQAGLLASENSKRDWPSLRLAVSTAAPLSSDTAKVFEHRFGRRLVQALGIIEAGLPLLNTTSDDPQALGQPDDFEFRVDTSSHEGELCLKGPGMFDAYLSPWRLREEVMHGGWFQTGDLARLNGDGNVRLVGRIKSVINVGGSKCYPEEIEDVLRTHDAVADVRVFGRPHERWGMLPVAEIVLREPNGTPPSSSQLTKFCRARLAPYKVPVSFITVDGLPMTATGKVRRA